MSGVSYLLCSNASSGHGISDLIDPATAEAGTTAWWRDWIGRFDRPTDWPEAVRRSLLTLKALTFLPTGGIVAASTLGLPEKPQGPMNWDYRYCWLRDSTFTLTALLDAGFHGEAEAWLQWLLRAVAGVPEKMRIMYRVDGGRQIEERELPELPGWNGARPVRVVNAAAGQRQLDINGEVLDSACLADRAGIPRSAKDAAVGARLVAHVERIWQETDQGMWESRAAPQHYVYSKLMAWVAVDRLLRLDDRHGDCSPERRGELKRLRNAIHADVCAKGFDASRNSFMQSYGSRHLDASVLLLPLAGFLPADDPRITGTIAAIEKDLTEDGFVRRQAAPWIGREEGVFFPCSCWLADCPAMQGRCEEARALFERVLAVSNDVGLLSEEYHVPSRRLLGNFPQALTHNRRDQHRPRPMRPHPAARRLSPLSTLYPGTSPMPIAVITGAGAGIGRAVAEEFASHGWSLALLSRDPDRLDLAAAELAGRYGIHALAIPTDVADAEGVEAAADRVERELGPIHTWSTSPWPPCSARSAPCPPPRWSAAPASPTWARCTA